MSAQTFDSAGAVLAAVGRDLGTTEWMPMTQQRIDERRFPMIDMGDDGDIAQSGHGAA